MKSKKDKDTLVDRTIKIPNVGIGLTQKDQFKVIKAKCYDKFKLKISPNKLYEANELLEEVKSDHEHETRVPGLDFMKYINVEFLERIEPATGNSN